MKNNSSQNRFGKITAKVIVMLLAVVLSLSVLPALSADILPDANAAAEYVVNANTSPATISAELERLMQETDVVDVSLDGNIDLSALGYKSGIVIPKGLTVNFYMNNYSITYIRNNKDEGSDWQLSGLTAFVNNGNLNIYAGSRSNPVGKGASINLTNIRQGMSISENEQAYMFITAIENSGNLTINDNVSVTASALSSYEEINDKGYGATSISVSTAVYNTSSSASVQMHNASVSVTAEARAIERKDDGDRLYGYAFAYGVYGGAVRLTGTSNVSVTSTGEVASGSDNGNSTFNDDRSNGRGISLAAGIVTDTSVEIHSNGTIKYSPYFRNRRSGTDRGTAEIYGAGVFVSESVTPVITDGYISGSTGNYYDRSDAANNYDNNCTVTLRDATVLSASTIPYSPEYLQTNCQTNVGHTTPSPKDVVVGSFCDETRINTYEAEMSTANGTHPKAMNRGALAGQNRVHVVYRYWTDSSRKTLDTSIVDADGNKGYSFRPTTSAPTSSKVVNTPVVFAGLSNTKLTVGNNTALRYQSGGDPCNHYYWSLYRLSFASANAAFSEYSMITKGTEFQTFETTGATNSQANITTGPIYIFVDYIKKAPSTIKANVGTADVVTTTYTGSNILASQLGLQIIAAVGEADITNEYNIDFNNNSSLVNVSFSFTSKNTAGVEITDTGRLPKNAGTYTVTLHIDESVTYDTDPNKSKNRKALDYKFTLIIEQAEVLRGDLPESFELTYGQKLNDIISVGTYNAGFLGTDNVSGTFSFVNAGDGSAYKNAGTGITQIKWTPTYGENSQEKNYKETVFGVTYNVKKAPLEIKPNTANVVYGESDVAFSSVISGLVANDNTENNLNIIKDALAYKVSFGGEYIAYQPGKITVGSYVIDPSFTTFPAVLANYEYIYKVGTAQNPEGVLKVTPRGLTVEAVAQDRAYIPGNFDVNVTFSIVSGKFGADVVRVTNATGKLENCDAGQLKVVNGISADSIKDKLAGDAKDNYVITSVKYKTGEELRVNISMAIPDAAIPVVAEMNYLQNRTLADVTLGEAVSTVAGSWQWVDSTINPTVNVSQYKAQFVPVDQHNYDNKVVDVTINVKPTPVTVGYSATVSYGDNVPNITNYTYTSDIDADFDIKKVTTSGNITPRTDYQKGSPVKAGGYVVTITAPNYVDVDGNYIFTVNNGIINVNPRLITFTVEDKTIVYGDSFYVDSTGAVNLTFDENLLVGTDTENSITVSGTAPVFRFYTDFKNSDNCNVGKYTIDATCTSAISPNYTVAVVPGTLHVTEAPLTIKANDITLEYGSDIPANLASALTLIGAKRNEKLENMISGDKTVSVNTSYTKGSPVVAGGYKVTVDITDVDFPNYKVTVQNGTITVVKATPVITTLPTATITYGQTLADAKFAGQVISGNIPGDFVYETPSISPAYSSEPYNAFKASFIPEDTVNYNIVTGKVVSLIVGKKPVSGNLSIAGIPMLDQELKVDVTGLDPAEIGVYTYKWFTKEKVDDGTGKLTEIITSVGTGSLLSLTETENKKFANKLVYVVATAAGSYEGEVCSNEILIAPELNNIETILTADTYDEYFVLTGLRFNETKTVQYNAEEQYVFFTGAEPGKYVTGNPKIKYNGAEDAPKNVGKYAVTVDISTPAKEDLVGLKKNDNGLWVNDEGSVVYSPVSNFLLGYIEITPTDYTVYVQAQPKVYDGTTAATATVVKEEGKYQSDDVKFSSSKVTYKYDTPDAGENKKVSASKGDYLTGDSADNYNLVIVINNGTEGKITPMPLVVTVSAVEREYIPGNNNVDLTFDFTPAKGDDGKVYVDASKAKGTIDEVTAGTRKVTVSGVVLDGTKAANYKLDIKDADKISVEITKATPSYPIPEVHEVLYYDSGRRLSSISLGDSHWAWDTPNAVPGAGVHTFKAIYTPVDQANYTTVEYNLEVEVLKTPVTITAASFTITYGDIEPTYYYVAEGLTGADNIADIDGYVLMNCNYQPGSNVGKYDIQLDGAFESDNYDFIYNNGVVTVGKRTAYVDVIAENREYKEGDTTVKVTFSALENLFSGDSASDVYLRDNYITGTIDKADAGTWTVKYEMPDLDGTKANNYKISPKKTVVTVEILKATIPNVNLPTSGRVFYGNKLSTIEFTSGSEGGQYGTFTMENPSSTPEKVGTFDKTYKVVFTPNDTKNYATISQYITVEVLPAFINVSVHLSGTIQVGKTLYAILNDIPPEAVSNIVFEWYRVDTPESDPRTGVKVASNTDSYRLTEEDAGKYIMCAVTNVNGSPYECNAICVSEISVEEQQLTFWQKFVNWFYKLISNFTQLFGGLFG